MGFNGGLYSGAGGQGIATQLAALAVPKQNNFQEMLLKYGPDIANAFGKDKYYKAASQAQYAEANEHNAKANDQQLQTDGRTELYNLLSQAGTQADPTQLNALAVRAGLTGDQSKVAVDQLMQQRARDAAIRQTEIMSRQNPGQFPTVGNGQDVTSLVDLAAGGKDYDAKSLLDASGAIKHLADKGILEQSHDDLINFSKDYEARVGVHAMQMAKAAGISEDQFRKNSFSGAISNLEAKNPDLARILVLNSFSDDKGNFDVAKLQKFINDGWDAADKLGTSQNKNQFTQAETKLLKDGKIPLAKKEQILTDSKIGLTGAQTEHTVAETNDIPIDDANQSGEHQQKADNDVFNAAKASALVKQKMIDSLELNGGSKKEISIIKAQRADDIRVMNDAQNRLLQHASNAPAKPAANGNPFADLKNDIKKIGSPRKLK